MSEYQYYEFQAIEKPLDERAQAALRQLTSRGEITATSLINVYHYGDFRGKPERLMEQYFDAHLYVANWGTHRLMLRLPLGTLDLAVVEEYAVEDVLMGWATKEHLILDFSSNPEDGGYDYEEGEDRLAPLLPLRTELLYGDQRCLYLAWLSGVESGAVDEEAVEPPVPPGLGKLTGAQQHFAEFLRISSALLAVAAAASERGAPTGPSEAELAAWVAKLAGTEKDRHLVRILAGEGPQVTGELLRGFWKDRAAAKPASAGKATPRRRASALLAARDEQAEKEERAAAERAAKKRAAEEGAKAAAREKHLDTLVGRAETLWAEVEQAIATKQPKQYDHAIELLRDLRDLAKRSGSSEAMHARLEQLRERHRAKSSLRKRLEMLQLP